MNNKQTAALDTAKEQMLVVGLDLIKSSDDNFDTVRLKRAVTELQNIIYTRDNIPL